MKTLTLELKKKLFIVEFEDNNHREGIIGLKDLKMEWDNGEEIKLIYKGSELTEEIAKEYVETKRIKNTWDDFMSDVYINYKRNADGYLDQYKTYALESFISSIEAQGYYWGENPVKHPEDFDDLPSSLSVYVDAENKHFEAELKTINPSKTLIFEII